MATRNKHTVKAAKNIITQRFKDEIEKLHEDYCKASAEDSGATEAEIQDAHLKYEQKCIEFDAWKEPKKKKRSKSIEWSSEYDASERPSTKTQKKIIDSDALSRVQKKVFKKSRPRASSCWLQEGCLVVKRGSTTPMIVLNIDETIGRVQVLNEGAVEYHRDLSLRAADFDE